MAIDIGLDRPEYADALVAAQAATGKPVVACTVDTPEMDRRLRAAGHPARAGTGAGGAGLSGARQPREAVAARGVSAAAHVRRRRLPAGLASRLATVRGPLGHADARALLEAYGVPFPRERIVATVAEALSAA